MPSSTQYNQKLDEKTVNEWIIVHPWMTFIVILVVIECVNAVVCNICNTIILYKREKKSEKDELPEQLEIGEKYD